MTKLHRTLISLALIAASTLSLFACNGSTPPADTTAAPSTTSAPITSAPVTTAAPETEPPIPEPAIRLETLTFDDSAYSITLTNATDYTVTLPAGRPRIPKINATAPDGVKVEIVNATIPDSATEGKAVIYLTQGETAETYTVTFVRDAAAGFVLQFDDRYTFKPSHTLAAGESYTFVSSDPAVATVDADGTVQILAVSESGVTVTASVGGKEVDTLKIDRTIKAPLNLFLLTGQSNAEGIKGVADESVKPAPGRGYIVEKGTTKLKDANAGRKGFAPAMLDEWYTLTGEKAVAVQTAVDGARIAKWIPTGEHYKMTTLTVERLVKKLESDGNYEIVRQGYVWHHGETDMSKGMSAEEYTAQFLQTHEAAKTDWGVTFGVFNIIRSTRSLSLPETLALGTHTDMLPIRAAQYALHGTLPDFTMISRSPEAATVASGLIYEDNVHHSQKGYNALGQDVARNLFSLLCLGEDRKPTSLSVYAYNGRDRYKDGDTIEIPIGGSVQLASIVMPLYTNDKFVTYTVEGDAVTISDSAMLKAAPTAKAGDTAAITVSGGGFTVKLNVKIAESALKAVNYTWDFNDLKETATGTELKLSALTTDPAYKLENGAITITNRITDFDMGLTLNFRPDFAWAIEYKGSVEKCSALFGEAQNKNNFVYITPYNSYASFRLVSEDGTKVDIPYGKYVDENYNEHVWRVENDPTTTTITLSMDGQKIAEKQAAKYNVTVTNLFGRYSASTNVCLQGKIDYVKVETFAK